MPKLRLRSSLAAAIVIIATVSQHSPAQQPVKSPAVDLGAFTKEIMAMDFKNGQTHLAMWLPYEFFVAAALTEGKLSKATVEKHLEFLTPYVTLVVQNGIEQPSGLTLYADEKEVRARTFLRLSDGSEISPLAEVPSTVTAALSAMKATISAEGDAGSANMHILIFPATTPRGQKVVDTSKKDQLTLVLKANPRFKETLFRWRTPFDSVVSVPDCPRCKAGVSAKWSHCPYCGQKLPH